MRTTILALLTAIYFPCVVAATPIVPVSYAYTAGPGPNVDYPDTGGTELTNGLFAAVSYLDPQWVGFQDISDDDGTAQPEITFDLGTIVNLNTVTIHYLSDIPDQVPSPDVVNIRFSDDDVTYSAVPLTFTGFGVTSPAALSSTINLVGNSGRYVRMEFLNDTQWTFFSEFEFDFVPPPVPEPGTLALLGGLGTTGLLTRRRRSAGISRGRQAATPFPNLK